MRKSIKILLSSFLAASQLSYCVPSIYATSGKSKSSSQQSTVLTYAKNAVLLPIKGAWWLAKANLKAAAIVIGDLTVLAGSGAGIGYCLYKAGVIQVDKDTIDDIYKTVKNIFENISKEKIEEIFTNIPNVMNILAKIINSNGNIVAIVEAMSELTQEQLEEFLKTIRNIGSSYCD